jgi:FMN-dependent NADH-azoreductase
VTWPPLDDSFAAARNTPREQLLPSQRAVLEMSDALVSELVASDIIIMAAGMINFGIPSTLKSYIDHILRPGATFKYTEKGPEGLVTRLLQFESTDHTPFEFRYCEKPTGLVGHQTCEFS